MKKIIKIIILSLIVVSHMSCDNSSDGNEEINNDHIKLLDKVYHYDRNYNLNNETTYFYDNNNRLISYFNYNETTTYIYTNNNITKVSNPQIEINYEYTNDLISKASTDDNGSLHEVEYVYNTNNILIQSKYYLNSVFQSDTFYTLDTNGNFLEITTNSNITTNEFDTYKNPYYFIHPLAHNIINRIGKNNNIRTETTNSSIYPVESIYEYDRYGYPTKKKTL